MNKVSIREFQQKANEYLSTLPILLTRYGTPVAKVVAVEWEIKDIGADVGAKKESVVTPSTDSQHMEEPEEVRVCQVPRCAETAVGKGKVWDERTGEMVEIDLCKKHLFNSLKETV